MNFAYWFSVALATTFLAWAHTHTDEIPIVLGSVLLASALLAAVFPNNFLITGVLTGGSLFFAEILVHYSVLHAPWHPSAGIPWVALAGYFPAALGVGIGVAIQRVR